MLGLLLMAVMSLAISSCMGCKGEIPENAAQDAYHDYDGVMQDFTAGVSQIQALHRQMMFTQVAQGKKYEWRNSKVTFDDVVKDDNIDILHVTDVTDVFQYMDGDFLVQKISSNVISGTIVPWPIHDLWIEDSDMSDLQIKLSAEDALQRLKEWNGVIPPVNFMSLRRPVGPKACNAQWVIGDVYEVIFIDAVTGDVSDTNPAFWK